MSPTELQNIFLSHGFELSPVETTQFQKFLTLFIEYNSHTNLSAIRDEEGIIEKHFVDSLYGASIVAEEIEWKELPVRLMDIGSGWGFPGIPLKIAIPELKVTLLDSVGKKVTAMSHFISELELSDISAIKERAEILALDTEHNEKYDFVVSRATAYITDILTWAKPFLKPDGKIILYKMPSDEERKDRGQILKKLKLDLTGELLYELAEKERVIFVFSKK